MLFARKEQCWPSALRCAPSSSPHRRFQDLTGSSRWDTGNICHPKELVFFPEKVNKGRSWLAFNFPSPSAITPTHIPRFKFTGFATPSTPERAGAGPENLNRITI